MDRYGHDRRARVELEGLNERVLARTPVGRWGTPEDMAGTAIYLATAASNFITASALPVERGRVFGWSI